MTTVHFQIDYQCVRCETYFLPYQNPFTVCPECGEPNLVPEEWRSLVDYLVETHRTHLGNFGQFTPPAYGIFSLMDHYVYYTATLLDLVLEGQGRDLVIADAVANESAAWKDHLRELLYRVFDAVQKAGLLTGVRNENVARGPGAALPQPPAGRAC